MKVLTAYNRLVPYFAYAQNTPRWREWRFRSISLRQAQTLVQAGEAEQVTRWQDGAVRVVGYRATKPTSWERPSPATLTYGTMCAVADAVGDPSGVQLTRGQRAQVLKFKVWPLIGDTKAVCVRPRISETERKEAEALLATPARPFRKAA